MLLEPSWNLTLQNLVEFWWNPHGILPQTSPDRGTLVEPWWNPGETLVAVPSWNLTSNHPGLADGGTLVGPLWNPCETFLKPARTTP